MVKVVVYILYVLAMLKFNPAFAQDRSNKLLDARFIKTIHDFGEIAYGGNGTYNFVFKNMGKKAIFIKHVSSTCGCTVPDWPKKPILPGLKASIVIKYDTKRVGGFIKNIKVYTSLSDNPINLQIRGTVLPEAK